MLRGERRLLPPSCRYALRDLALLIGVRPCNMVTCTNGMEFSVSGSQFTEEPRPQIDFTGTGNRELRTVLLRQFVSREEKAQLEARRFIASSRESRCVRCRWPISCGWCLFGAGRVGGAHQFAQIGDGVFLLQRQSHDGPLDMNLVSET